MKHIVQIVAAISLLLTTNTVKAADALETIIANGKMSVGVAAGYKPYGFINEKGELVGLTEDLLADLSERLNKKAGKTIEIEKVPVTAQNRFQFLQQGRIDIIVSTVNVSPERKKLFDMIDPGFYATGVTVFAKKEFRVKSWADLKGKTLCTQQGAFFNKPTAEKYGLTLEAYATAPEQTQALLDSRCYASLDDDSHAASLLSDEARFGGYELALPPELVTPWAIVINHGNPKFHDFLTEVNSDWLKEGTIKVAAKKWGVPPIQWLDQVSSHK